MAYLCRRLITGAAVLVCLAPALHAKADWEFTTWTMTLDQVIAASKGTAVRLSDEDARKRSTYVGATCFAQLQGPYDAGGISFSKVNFCFGSGGSLAWITLNAAADDFFLIDQALASQFGAPIYSSQQPYPTRVYKDPQKRNSIELVRLGSVATILRYRPMENRF